MEVLRNLLLSFSSSNILFIHSFTYTHVKRISVFLPRLLSLFWCFICPRFGQWKPFWDNLCGCLICFHHFEVHAYFLGYDVPSFSHSSADTPDQVAFPPPSYSRPSSFCLDSDIPHQAVHHVWALHFISRFLWMFPYMLVFLWISTFHLTLSPWVNISTSVESEILVHWQFPKLSPFQFLLRSRPISRYPAAHWAFLLECVTGLSNSTC